MPKLVDHDARRAEIARATWTAVRDVGIERLRLRDIADEVGFTTGVFAHYFRDKGSVLRYAFNLAYQHAHEQILQSNESVDSGLMRLRNALVALIPDPKQPESVAFVSMCFGIRNISDPLLTADYRKKRNAYGRLLRSCIRDAISEGEILVDTAPNEIIDLVFAVLDGVCIAALLNPDGYSKKRGSRIVDTMIERLSGGRANAAETETTGRKKTKGGTP